MPVTVAAFYKFVPIDNPEVLRFQLAEACCAARIKGTILLAPEGINATISGTADAMARFLDILRSDPRFGDMAVKLSETDAHPFRRLKVKVKREIITFGVPEADPSVRVGTYVAPVDWNALISAPDVVVIDTRNAYEAAIGSFANAIDPKTRAFSEFPAFVERALDPQTQPKVAMFCTGGIRCEKASSYMLARGFTDVYHLKGGILDYLAAIPPDQSLWRGECFVFDERVALQHGCVEGEHVMCKACGQPYVLGGPVAASCPNCASTQRDVGVADDSH